jgi:hypothetical protein
MRRGSTQRGCWPWQRGAGGHGRGRRLATGRVEIGCGGSRPDRVAAADGTGASPPTGARRRGASGPGGPRVRRGGWARTVNRCRAHGSAGVGMADGARHPPRRRPPGPRPARAGHEPSEPEPTCASRGGPARVHILPPRVRIANTLLGLSACSTSVQSPLQCREERWGCGSLECRLCSLHHGEAERLDLSLSPKVAIRQSLTPPERLRSDLLSTLPRILLTPSG